MADQFSFPDDFQNLVLACWVRHADQFYRYGDLLDPTYFQGSLATIVARCVRQYMNHYQRIPGWHTVMQLTCTELKRTGEETDKGEEFIDMLEDMDTKDVTFVIDRLRDFAKERATINAIKKAVNLMREGKSPDEFGGAMVKDFEAALAVGTDLDDMGYMLHSDYEGVVDKITTRGYGTMTGYPQLDEIWKRGWGPGWLIVPLAPPKRFKSIFCTNLAINMVGPQIQGDVLYYSCEITPELTIARMLHNVTGLTDDVMYNSKEEFLQACRERVNNSIAGNLLVKGYPSKAVTMRQIETHAARAVAQFNMKPVAIVIDYAETVLSSVQDGVNKGNVSEHQSQAQIYIEARAMGARFNCPVIMPDRCNKETVAKGTPSMTSFQGSFQKAGAVDIAIGLCATDAEYAAHIQRTFVFLNRHGAAYQHFKGKVSAHIARYDIGESIPFEADDEDGGGSSGGGRGGRGGGRRGGGDRLGAAPSQIPDEFMA